MSNIHKLEGVALHGEPDEELIRSLEELLAAAKTGDIRALAYAVVLTNDVRGTGWDGVAGTATTLHSAIAMLMHRFTDQQLNG